MLIFTMNILFYYCYVYGYYYTSVELVHALPIYVYDCTLYNKIYFIGIFFARGRGVLKRFLRIVCL